MKSTKRSTIYLNRKTLLILGVILLLVGLYTVTAYAIKLFPFTSNQTSTTSAPDDVQSQQATDSQQKKDFIENSGVPQTSKSSTPSSSKLSDQDSVVVSAEQKDSNTVVVSAKLYGYSDGTCTLTVTNGSHVSSQTVSVIFQPEYSTCAGFSVSVGDNGTGTWNLSLTITESGQSITKQLSVEVK